MRIIIVQCMVFAICLGAGGGSANGQDFGQLLEAVDKLEAQELGAGAFVQKPVTKHDIAAAVRTALDRQVEAVIAT